MEQSGAKKSNKITEIVRMQQMLKKWRKLSVTPKDPSSAATAGSSNGSGNAAGAGSGESKAKKFLKRTLSFTESPAPRARRRRRPRATLRCPWAPRCRGSSSRWST